MVRRQLSCSHSLAISTHVNIFYINVAPDMTHKVHRQEHDINEKDEVASAIVSALDENGSISPT